MVSIDIVSFLLQNLKLSLLFLSHQLEFISFRKSLLIAPHWNILFVLFLHFSMAFCLFPVQLLFSTEQIWSWNWRMHFSAAYFEKHTEQLHGDPSTLLFKQWGFTSAGQSYWLLGSFFLWLVAEGRFVHRSTTVRVQTEFLHLSFCFHTPQEGSY